MISRIRMVVTNPHPKDLSKSPAVAGFFVSPIFVL